MPANDFSISVTSALVVPVCSYNRWATTSKIFATPLRKKSSFRSCAELAQEYSKALGRTITFQDIRVEPWRDELLARGLPVHLVNHLATMADLHRAGRYDRMSDDVLTLTGQGR
jgi:hypothetical protein